VNSNPDSGRLVNGNPGSSEANETEARLRAASQALLDRFPDRAVLPLRLPTEHPEPRLSAGRRTWRRARPWLIPLAAAAAVLAAVTLPPALSRSLGRTPAAPATAAPQTSPDLSGPEGTPPYFIQGSTYNAQPFVAKRNYAVVRSTATGRTLAAVKLPNPYAYVSAVSAAANDRTFVLAVAPHTGPDAEPEYAGILMLHFDPSRNTASLTTPPIGPLTGFCGFALSPDGLKLAVTSSRVCLPTLVNQYPYTYYANKAAAKITVYSVATGSSRSWRTTPSVVGPLAINLGWMANNRQLGFTWETTMKGEQHESWLNTDATGGLLPLTSSSPLPADLTQDIATSGGSLVAFSDQSIIRYIQVGGHLRLVRSHIPDVDVRSILWANSTGTVLIVNRQNPPSAKHAWADLAILSHGHYRSLAPWDITTPVAW